MSTDIRASENGLWCPIHSSLFSSGVKFWQPSELGTFARRPRKVFFFGKRKKKKMDEERAKFSKFGAGLLFETRKKNTSFALTLNMLTTTLHKNNAIRRQLYLIPLCMMYITFLSTPSQLQDKNVACGQFNASNRIQIFRSLVRKFGPLKLRLVLLVSLATLFNLKPK